MALTSHAEMKSKASKLMPNCARHDARHLVLVLPLGGAFAGALKVTSGATRAALLLAF